jgi:hypothetical protein
MKNGFTVAAGILFLFISCSTRINSRWQNKEATPQKYNKILVLAIVNHNEDMLRKNLEEHLAGDLKFIGYEAISSFREYGPVEFSSDNEKVFREKLRKSGVDAVLTVVLLDKKKEKFYVPEKLQYTPYSIYNNNLPSYYKTMQTRVMTDGYYEEQTKYFLECNFYRADDKALLYSVQTVSFESGSLETLAHQYGRTVILDMIKRKIFLKPDESSLYQKSF